MTGVVGLHASFTVSDETIEEAGALCRELGTVLHVHLAEDGADIEDARRRGHTDPLERLVALDALPPGSILAHGVHLPADRIARAAELGAWFVQNPRSNRGNRVGYPRHLTASSRVALGTDGYPSRMEEETTALLELAEEHGEPLDEVRRRPERSPELAGERLGLTLGSLEPGRPADVGVFEAPDRPRHLVVNGRIIVEDGRLVTADHKEIRRHAEAIAPDVWRRMEELPR